MALSKAFTTVTPFSKLVALLMFVGFPFLGFYLGTQFQQSITPQYPPLQYETPPKETNQRMVPPTEPTGSPVTHTPAMKACALDAKQCTDGSYVGRTGPHCEFALCPPKK